MPAPSVLIVDDEENIRLVLRAMLRSEGYLVRTASSAEEALAQVEEDEPSFILSDVRMGAMSGIELAAALKAKQAECVTIVMSAYGTVELAIEAMKAGAYDYISKPFKKDEVLLALRKAEERESLRRENEQLREQLRAQTKVGEMIGQSAPMQRVFQRVKKAAGFRTTVLVQGESGTGKELVARALHKLGDREGQPFVAVNCGAIPAALLESELFGHKRGAFTDASSDKIGLFEQASGGTLFLDEIGELALALQVKLLRALQEGQIRPLGATKDVHVDVRVIAATHKHLSEEVDAGRFREDLYYRLNVLQIEVPPLREREGDLPLLIDHFIAQMNARLGTQIQGVSHAARKALLSYDWPGNVRELENAIEHAIVLSEGDRLERDDLPERMRADRDPAAAFLRSGELSIKKMQRYMEHALIKRALEETEGNRTAAAKLLEISHRALLYKLKDYDLS